MMRTVFLYIIFFISYFTYGQSIPVDKVISIESLSDYLNNDIVNEFGKENAEPVELGVLAKYFRDKFSERYFYDWRTFDKRFEHYNQLYPNVKASHIENSSDHMDKFNANTQWILPFDYLNGQPVNAYALRHLARQHKMVDVSFNYFYHNKDEKYLDYFTSQMESLNAALFSGEYESIKDGNGIYEAFRSGYRVLNWLQIHNMFLGEETYSDEEQLITIATLLQHGAHLYQNNKTFSPGNHQTRGLSALAMISILFRDFKGTDEWYEHAIKLLGEHMSEEINEDGFQFERTIHYHISDIGNYFYVYQLANKSKLSVNSFWKNRLRSLFETLTKVAYPDKSAPVFSDDTDQPWAEKNDISNALTLGYVLFSDPSLGYFSNKKVEAKMYWYLSETQLKTLQEIQRSQPTFNSVEFPITGYYIMREGWDNDDKMMAISAGLDDLKPDHQHGDMLGIQAMGNGKVILPNYQVRYSLKDLELFKNSLVKNVALVDDEFQGKKYTSNKGGSGFGKFKKLPDPKIIVWKKDKEYDLFIGSHNGFEDIGVAYSRQILFIKDNFWIVKDNFNSPEPHTYKQVWQGHYSTELAPDLIRSTFDDASGCDIYQLNSVDDFNVSGKRGKNWIVVSKKGNAEFSFITVIYPYKGYSNRIDETLKEISIKNWKVNDTQWKVKGSEQVSLTNEEVSIFFSVKNLELNDIEINLTDHGDLKICTIKDGLIIQSISQNQLKMSIKGKKQQKVISLLPGEEIKYIKQND